MNNINYNLKRHVELLKLKEKVLSQDKSFLKENEAEFLELIKYDAAVEQHLLWEDRFEILSRVKTFLNGELNAQDFHDSVFGLRETAQVKSKKFLSRLASGEIKDFFPTKKPYQLATFLSNLYFKCENFETNWDEETFRNSIRNEFLKYQKFLTEE